MAVKTTLTPWPIDAVAQQRIASEMIRIQSFAYFSRSEGSGYRQAEGFGRLAELVTGAIQLLSLRVRVIACAARREHRAGDQVLARRLLRKTQRVNRVVDAERRIDDRHDYLQLRAEGHAGHVVGASNRPDELIEDNLRSAFARAVVVARAAVQRSIEAGCAFRALLQLIVIH